MLKIEPTPPFDFDLSAKIFSDGDKQICKYSEGKFLRVIQVNDKLILIVIESKGSVNEPEILVELESNGRILDDDRKITEEVVCSLFDLKLDLKSFYKVVRSDKVMSKLTQKLYGLKSGTTPTVFEALVYSIIEQQISLNVAFSMEKRLIKTFGDVLRIDNEVYYAFPTPQKLVSATIDHLRSCGLSSKKAEYIRDISNLITDGELDLEKFKNYRENEDIIKELCKIRGVGIWTAELTMVRGMHKLDAIPADDLGLRRYISRYYCNDRRISGEEARKIAEEWGEWKGLASFYLIMAGRLGVKI